MLRTNKTKLIMSMMIVIIGISVAHAVEVDIDVHITAEPFIPRTGFVYARQSGDAHDRQNYDGPRTYPFDDVWGHNYYGTVDGWVIINDGQYEDYDTVPLVQPLTHVYLHLSSAIPDDDDEAHCTQ